ncbi:methyltransferase [Mucilaginibacter sp. ZT4R22]|uniref:tRNA1(Val) (adenine(37)-N6)-methyltransferase n=2 Tax=Mucilaginibacter pankratovii TaxID=2772110 RepID=A0ABR7WUJ3_9SPHI|nr:methyltransferase [Mucilaginibacter pankratovii]
MKVNTDGVLLGALANASAPKTILDIGTGTGVIALMLAQRFQNAIIDAVEIDEAAANTAEENFKRSKFANRLQLFSLGFDAYFETNPEKKYDLIVSNPPFFLNSLTSPGAKKSLARHTDGAFFERLIKSVSNHLATDGVCAMILPLETADLVKELAIANGLYLQGAVNIKSFVDAPPNRQIVTFGRQAVTHAGKELVIYNEPKVYSSAYQNTLKEFLTIF